ncbi:MAG: SH3 domain-containing protein [Reichenbachiella sp.]
MTKIFLNTIFILGSIILFNCSSNPESQAEGETEAVTEEELAVVPEPIPAVCIWDKILVRESPSQDAKSLTRISVGESLFYLGKDTTVEKRAYTYVKLNDGQEGWALKDFIVNNARPAVVLNDISLYSRPDLLTKLDKTFKMMDIISSIEIQDDWMKIKGRRSGAKWMDEGWVKSANISFEAVDIAGAKFGLEALSIEDESKKIEALIEIINNTDLSNSKFIQDLAATLDELNSPELESDIDETSIGEEASVEGMPTDSVQ